MPNQPTKNEISSVDSQSLSEKTPGSSEARNQAPVPSARLTIVLDFSTPARACVARSWSEYGPSSAPIRWITKALGMVMAHPLRDGVPGSGESPEDTPSGVRYEILWPDAEGPGTSIGAGILTAGEVAERLMAALLKSAESKDFVGSNPTLSATRSTPGAPGHWAGRPSPLGPSAGSDSPFWPPHSTDVVQEVSRSWAGSFVGWVRARLPRAWFSCSWRLRRSLLVHTCSE